MKHIVVLIFLISSFLFASICQGQRGRYESGADISPSTIDYPNPFMARDNMKPIRGTPRFVDACDSATGWAGAGGVTPSLESTDPLGAGEATIKLAFASITANDFQYCGKDLSSPIDVRDCTITLRYYIDYGDNDWYGDGKYPKSFRFYLSSYAAGGAAAALYDRMWCDIPMSDGWHTMDLAVSNLSRSAECNPDDITAWGIYLNAHATGGHDDFEMYIDRMVVTPSRRNKGAVVFTFDDAYDQQYHVGAKYMAKYGLRGTIYAEMNSIGTGNRMTLAQLTECQDKYGFHIGAHWSGTYFDIADFNATASETALRNWLEEAKRQLYVNGFGSGSDYFAIPGGTTYLQSEAHLNIMRDYFVGVRGTTPWWTRAVTIFANAQDLVSVADAEGDDVTITTEGDHGWIAGTSLIITGTTNYNSTAIAIQAVPTTASFNITDTYAAETFVSGAQAYPHITNNTQPAALGSGEALNIQAQSWNPLESYYRYATQISAANLAAALTKVVRERSVLIFYYHNINTGADSNADISETDFKSMIDAVAAYVASGDLDVLTIQELHEQPRQYLPLLARHESFVNVPAIDDDKIVATLNPVAASTALTIADQPDVPRTLICTYTEGGPAITSAWNILIEGTDAAGNYVSEYVEFAASGGTAAPETLNAFAVVISATTSATLTGVDTGDTIKIGTGDTLGLSHLIEETGDVYKYAENGADAAIPTITATDAIHSTVDVTTATNGTNDYDVWYRSRF